MSYLVGWTFRSKETSVCYCGLTLANRREEEVRANLPKHCCCIISGFVFKRIEFQAAPLSQCLSMLGRSKIVVVSRCGT